MKLKASKLHVSRGRVTLLGGVSFALEAGEKVALVGANGAGKSTLLRALIGLDNTVSGEIILDEKPLHAWRREEIARRITLVLQDTQVDVNITVRRLVSLGRFPHRGQPSQRDDLRVVEEALRRTDLLHLRDRGIQTLSGGERQRAHLARAIAQDTKLLLLDEPTSHLDVRHQLETLSILDTLSQDGRGIAMAVHDLSLAMRWAGRVVVMKEGAVVSDDVPHEALSEMRIREAFGVHAAHAMVGDVRLVAPLGVCREGSDSNSTRTDLAEPRPTESA